MPQMKPMNWILLFIFMNLILMFINIMNFYFFNSNFMNNKNLNKIYKNISWKW